MKKILLFTLSFMGLYLLQTPTFAEQTQLRGVKIIKGAEYVSLIFTVNAPRGYKVFTLSHPTRLVVDIRDAHLRTKTNKLDLAGTPLLHIRHGRFDAHTLRVVLDLDIPIAHYNATMRGLNPSQAELVVDLYPANTDDAAKPQVPAKLQVPEKPKEQSIAKIPHIQITEAIKTRKVVVVIDPGHGGKDPGTIGHKGTQEKEVVLSIALRLAELINRDPSLHAVLTRKGDYFVALRNRLRLARKDKADLFVAIHADSFFNNHLTGASVYALSQHGATTEAARWLARRENYSELGGVSLSGLRDQSYILRSVLIDLAQTATINDSIKLGSLVLDSLQNVTALHYFRVEQAPFMVLKSPDIPSILIETGFLSNPREEERLRQADYRDKLAQAILGGVRRYIATHPVTGSETSSQISKK